VKEWIPKTTLGKMVLSCDITSMEQIYEKGLPILEPEIVDKLLPDLQDHVLKINSVQRSTDSGRKGSFSIIAAIGNRNGFAGVGIGKGIEVRPTIERAIREAKKNIVFVKRGCGSWECGCSENHSIPFKVKGRKSSVKVELLPAPKGTGIVAGKTVKKVLELAGVKDAWSRTTGNSGTVFNAAYATMNALRNTRKMRIQKE
jgi:small subunit ribosomal protein S5